MRACAAVRCAWLFAAFVAFTPAGLSEASARGSAQPDPPVSRPGDPPAASADQPVTPEQIAAVEQRLENEPAQRDAALAALNEARAALSLHAEFQAALARFQQEIDNAPAVLEATRTALAAPAPDPAASVPAGAPLEELERLLAQAQAQLQASRGQLTADEGEPAARERRREAIPGELAEAQRVLEEAQAARDTPAPDGTAPLLAEALRLADQAAMQTAQARVAALQRELASLNARRENLQARVDLSRRNVGESEALVRHLEGLVSEGRRLESQREAQAAREARERAADASPRVQEVLADTERLAARIAADRASGAPGAEILAEGADDEADASRLALAELAADYRSTFERVETIGLTDTMGRLLREKRRRLESPLELEERIEADRETRAAVLLDLFELRPLVERWGDPAAAARDEAAGVSGLSEDERAALQSSLHAAMTARFEAARDLRDHLERYQAALGERDRADTARLTLLRAYIQEIDRTILWVPSHHPVNARDPEEIAAGFRWLFDAGAWRRAISAPGGMLDDLRDRPVSTLGPLLAVLLLALFLRPVMGRVTDRMHERARRVATDSFRLTMQALLLGALIAALVPLLLLSLYGVLRGAGDASGQAPAVGMGVLTAAGVLFGMLLLRRLTRRGGLAEVHFRWPDAVTASVRSKLRWLMPLALATLPLMAAMSLDPDTPGGPALARLALVLWLLGLAIALYRLLRPRGPAISHFLKVSPGGWIDRLRYVWYPLLFGVPVALAVIAMLGYVETARELQLRFRQTLGLALGLILISAIVTRWITLARRRVAMEAARRRREAMAAEHAKELGGEGTPTVPAAAVEAEQGANLEQIDEQTRQLLRFGVGLTAIFATWALWVGVLPALGMLERIELWPSPRVIDKPQIERPWEAAEVRELLGEPPAVPDRAPAPPATAAAAPAPANGSAAASSSSLPIPAAAPPVEGEADDAAAEREAFTLSDALTVLVLALATWVAARNVPGVVEIVLLQHLPLDRGARYAVTTIFRYTILIIGVSATLNAAGIEWGSVQWLAAALTFGLGFGLQEIFANFVSGLIILAERPIRIGDVVTVSGTTGGVSRIRMRATTITDINKRELIVPNRAFITDPVINWTLSDASTQMVVTLGVAYGSDVNLVRDTLLKVARASSYLMPGSEPVAIFTNFGPSTLDFELRLWAKDIATSHLAKDELLRGIERAFRENSIEIAFPRQDINIRSINLPPGVMLGVAEKPATQAGPAT